MTAATAYTTRAHASRGQRELLHMAIALSFVAAACGVGETRAEVAADAEASAREAASKLIADGRQVFRFDTFGDEQFWTDTLKLHEVIERSVDPTTALKAGLKVDSDVLPPGLLVQADLTRPATTVALLKLNAIVGVKAEVDADNHITRLGITCALCHSTVDDAVAPGIGRRMDGWPNRDLNVGAIVALSGALSAEQKAVYNSWGPGKYDPRYNIDGKSTPLVIPPAYGLADVRPVWKFSCLMAADICVSSKLGFVRSARGKVTDTSGAIPLPSITHPLGEYHLANVR